MPMQVVADYVAMTPDGKVFDSSLDKGRPYDLRIGSGQVNNLLHFFLLLMQMAPLKHDQCFCRLLVTSTAFASIVSLGASYDK